jgi:hypothetical protein
MITDRDNNVEKRMMYGRHFGPVKNNDPKTSCLTLGSTGARKRIGRTLGLFCERADESSFAARPASSPELMSSSLLAVT